MQTLTMAQRKVIAHEARLELARRSYLDYCFLVHNGTWKPYAVHRLLCEKLDEVLSGKCRRLIVSMPPRHGKSQTVSETFPSYYLMRYPDRKVIVTSKDDALATRFGLMNRRKVEEYGRALYGVQVSRGQASKTDWGIDGRFGGCLCVPIMGGITGHGAHLLVIDDPVKNREEADSATMREKLWNEWQNTLRTRLERGAAVIVIMTRWHEDDLAGRLLAQGGWETLTIPCICESEHDALQREMGEPLCAQLGFDAEWAKQTQRDVGSRTWNALYQQRPAPQEGGLFRRDWIKRYDKLPDTLDEWTQSWDLSFEGGKNSDYVGGGVWARKGSEHYLVAPVHERLDFTATIRKIRLMSAAYPQAVKKLIENKANGPAVISALRKEIAGIVPVSPQESKTARANAVTPFFEAGNIHVPLGKAGDDYIEELCAFPTGAHDDMVDMTSQYLKTQINAIPTARIRAVTM